MITLLVLTAYISLAVLALHIINDAVEHKDGKRAAMRALGSI